jgi:tryptophan 6-halogenase
MQKQYEIVIVGGGTAGWMTAAYLSKALDRDVRISLIESPAINTIGVGEATFSTVRLFFDFLGLPEEDWMPECNAAYKLAIKFTGWNPNRPHFYHPFQRFGTVRGHSLSEWWLKFRGTSGSFDYACFTVPSVCDRKCSPRFSNGETFDSEFNRQLELNQRAEKTYIEGHTSQYPYAYHFDASLLAKYLSRYAQSRGVVRISDSVAQVRMDESGSIASLQTEKHGILFGDLFIDCTGFRSLLLNGALHEPFVSFSDSLLCDSAIAMQIPADGKTEGIEPYTTATALSCGWVWNIPLFCRTGTGYVYASGFLNPEEAEREFRAHLGPRAAQRDAMHIKMRIGRARNSWVKNCVAIGLSSGFVEPLESTGIFFIQHAIEEVVRHFPGRAFPQAAVASYNKTVGECIDGVREFLTLHYVASSRDDTPFWRAAKRDVILPGDLGDRLELWKHRLPTSRTINPHYHGFEAYSYSTMLLGLGSVPEQSPPVLDVLEETSAREAFETIRTRSVYLTASLPSQYSYLSTRYEALCER